jgi:hypothetical protein
VFAKVNAAGGIDGKKIDYITLDDKGDPATAAQDARLLITQDGAVALTLAVYGDIARSRLSLPSVTSRLPAWDTATANG